MSTLFVPSAKVIIRHPGKQNQILLVKRKVDGVETFEPAGGRAEINYDAKKAENLEECAIREVKEETGAFIKIDYYLASYSFFWPHDLSKCSLYAVFAGTYLGADQSFKGNGANDEWPIEPVWINERDIISKKITINPVQTGLLEIILNYLQH
jgi:8-oxo-dGTP pyrophosphatase MutT (NUDIX family)